MGFFTVQLLYGRYDVTIDCIVVLMVALVHDVMTLQLLYGRYVQLTVVLMAVLWSWPFLHLRMLVYASGPYAQ